MTITDSRTKLYNYYDKVTADILVRWAERYAEEKGVSFDYALVVILLDVNTHKGAL